MSIVKPFMTAFIVTFAWVVITNMAFDAIEYESTGECLECKVLPYLSDRF